MRDLLGACQHYIQTQYLCKEEGDKEKKTDKGVFITISRQTGAGGLTVGRLLAEYLEKHSPASSCSWTVFENNLIRQVMEKHNLPARFRRYLKENAISEIDDTLEDLFKVHPSKWLLVRKMTETILHLAQMGRVIIVGRGASITTRGMEGGLHVRLVGSFEKRLKHIREYYRLNEKQARIFVSKREREKTSFLKKYFDRNIDDVSLYDLIINTDHVSYEEAAAIIGRTAIERFKECQCQTHQQRRMS